MQEIPCKTPENQDFYYIDSATGKIRGNKT